VVRLRAGQKAVDVMETIVEASMVLLDAFSTKAYGGTGEKVEWELAAEIVRLSKLPVMLAGGLTADNVAEAIRVVRPYAVDVSSGVEEKPGIKDPAKVRDFIRAVRSTQI
jgi:phosphoribosylanthranilate isomerase